MGMHTGLDPGAFDKCKLRPIPGIFCMQGPVDGEAEKIHAQQCGKSTPLTKLCAH